MCTIVARGGGHKHARLGGSGGMLPREFFKIRCTEIASVDILGQKQSRNSYMACGVLHPMFGCPCMHVLSQLTSISTREGTLRLTGQ